ncbi:hypothetical protein ACLB2K_016687 [Fragaria x ananassa]
MSDLEREEQLSMEGWLFCSAEHEKAYLVWAPEMAAFSMRKAVAVVEYVRAGLLVAIHQGWEELEVESD